MLAATPYQNIKCFLTDAEKLAKEKERAKNPLLHYLESLPAPSCITDETNTTIKYLNKSYRDEYGRKLPNPNPNLNSGLKCQQFPIKDDFGNTIAVGFIFWNISARTYSNILTTWKHVLTNKMIRLLNWIKELSN